MSTPHIVCKKIEPGKGLFSGTLYTIRELDSTNTHMGSFSQSYDHGDVLFALEQTGGRGRQARRWISVPGASLTFSIRLNVPSAQQVSLGQAAALAVVKWLEKRGISASIKWPNDILIQERKISGILVETQGHRSVLGIGINLNLNENDLKQIPQPATSLLLLSGQIYELEETLLSLLHEIEVVLSVYFAGGFKKLVPEWKKYLAFYGRYVKWRSGNVLKEVWVRDVQADGRLLINDGKRDLAISLGEIAI